MLVNPLMLFSSQPAIAQQSIQIDNGLTVHYRHDLPGELNIPDGFSHHMLTFFLSKNEQQTTQLDEHGKYCGQMNPGDFYLYPANISGRTSWHSEDKTLHLVMEPSFLNKVVADTEWSSSDNIELLPALKESDRTLNNLIHLLLIPLNNPSNSNVPSEKLYLESLSSLLGIHLLRQYCNITLKNRQSTTGLPPSKLKEIFDYIQANLSQELSLDTMAAQLNLSRCHFATQFKQSTGIPPHRYVSQQRIEKAKHFLRSRKHPIADIALACGFANQSHLTTVFKKHSGTTPKAYQAQQ